MVKDISRRAFMKVGVALSMAFSALLAACTGREVYDFEFDELEFLNGLTREELNERLRELAENPDETEVVMGAMCYSPVERDPEYILLSCSTCNANAQFQDWQIWSLERIQATVNTMIREGFDAKLELIVSCKKCAEQDRASYRTVFGIRFKDDADYHLAESSNVTDYEIVLAFLQGETTYHDSADWVYPLYREQQVIKRMTGLKYD